MLCNRARESAEDLLPGQELAVSHAAASICTVYEAWYGWSTMGE